jgi:hypothetical protein
MDRGDDGVGLGCQEAVEQMAALDRISLGAANAIPSGPCPGKATSGRVSSIANHLGVFFGLVSAYSQNDDIGTKHRFSGPSPRRQCCDLVLRILVVMPGN